MVSLGLEAKVSYVERNHFVFKNSGWLLQCAYQCSVVIAVNELTRYSRLLFDIIIAVIVNRPLRDNFASL